MFLEKEEMKFIVLYALKQYKAPMKSETFYDIITWDKDIMGFFDAAAALSELDTGDYVEKTFYRNEECYALTENGAKALELFGEKFPKSIQNKIDDAIGKLRYDTLADPKAVYAEVLPVTHKEYGVKLSVMDDHKPLMELSLRIGDRKVAEDVAESFKENSDKIYEEILKICMPE